MSDEKPKTRMIGKQMVADWKNVASCSRPYDGPRVIRTQKATSPAAEIKPDMNEGRGLRFFFALFMFFRQRGAHRFDKGKRSAAFGKYGGATLL